MSQLYIIKHHKSLCEELGEMFNLLRFTCCPLTRTSYSGVQLLTTILYPVSYTTKMLGIRITESRVSSESSSSSEDEESSVFYNIEEEEDCKTQLNYYEHFFYRKPTWPQKIRR